MFKKTVFLTVIVIVLLAVFAGQTFASDTWDNSANVWFVDVNGVDTFEWYDESINEWVTAETGFGNRIEIDYSDQTTIEIRYNTEDGYLPDSLDVTYYEWVFDAQFGGYTHSSFLDENYEPETENDYVTFTAQLETKNANDVSRIVVEPVVNTAYLVEVEQTEGGTIFINDEPIDTPFAEWFEEGSDLTFDYEADSGYNFYGWIDVNDYSAGIQTSGAVIQNNLSEDIHLMAYFVEIDEYFVEVDKIGEGNVWVDGSIVTEFPETFLRDEGSIVRFDAGNIPNWQFIQWIVDGQEIEPEFDSATETYFIEIEILDDVEVTAEFTDEVKLEVDMNRAGVVTIDGDEVDLPFVEWYEVTTDVNITAEAGERYEIAYFVIDGERVEDISDVTLSMNENRVVNIVLQRTYSPVDETIGDLFDGLGIGAETGKIVIAVLIMAVTTFFVAGFGTIAVVIVNLGLFGAFIALGFLPVWLVVILGLFLVAMAFKMFSGGGE